MVGEDFVFLAHFIGPSIAYWLDQPAREVFKWYQDSIEVYKQMNKAPTQ